MAFQTSSATGQDDLLSQLYTFLGTVSGWTQEYDVSAPDVGSDRQIAFSHIRDTTTWYYTLVTRNTVSPQRIELGVSTGSSSGNNLYAQTGTFATSTSVAAKAMLPYTGPLTYWFFATDQYCHIAIQVSTYFQYLSFGEISLQAGYTKGIYGLGSRITNASTDYDSALNQQPLFLNYTSTGSVGVGSFRDSSDAWIGANPPTESFTTVRSNTENASADVDFPSIPFKGGISTHTLAITNVLVPFLIFPPHPSIASKRTFAGYMEDIYATASENQTLPTEITIGSDVYVLTPFWRVGTNTGSFAFKKIP